MAASTSLSPSSDVLADKGKIEQGADADLVMFREGLTTKLTQGMVTAHCGWTPYLGREVGRPPDLSLIHLRRRRR